MAQSLILKQDAKQTQNLKQNHLLMMLPQMQQAITLLQLPVLELSTLIDQELEQNPLLEYDTEQEQRTDELLWLERDTQEPDGDEAKIEQEINLDDADFAVLKQLDEDFRSSENGDEYTPQTSEDSKRKTFQDSSIVAHTTLFAYLMEQAQTAFQTPEELRLAEALIGNFDERGFLETSLGEIAALNNTEIPALETVLQVIQTFEPFGVGARNVQESLLIQLAAQGKSDSLEYLIVAHHYDDMLHNRLPAIQKGLKHTYEAIEKAITEHISKLDLRPGAALREQQIRSIVPDIAIKEENEQLVIEINHDSIPGLRVNKKYLRMLEDPNLNVEAKDYIKRNILSAKWFVKNIFQRNETLHRIAEFLITKQKTFLTDPTGKLAPLTMREVANDLGLHESTIARAVANKYVDTPRGILPLRSFFTNAYVSEEGEDLSAQTVRNAIQELIAQESKSRPLSDDAISKQLKKQGIICARRTVAKHRYELGLGNALQRRKYGKA